MMTSGVSFLASLANRVSFEHCTQGTPLLLPSHRPQLLVIAPTWSGPVSIVEATSLTGGGLSTGNTLFSASSSITGTGNITKVGIGTVTLAGTNSYVGTTTVSAGTLLVNSSIGTVGTPEPVAVSSGATLGGSGTIVTGTGTNGLEISNGAFLEPTSSSSPLTVAGDATVDGSLDITLSGDTPSGLLSDSGNLTLNSDSSLDVNVSGTQTQPVYVLASYGTLAAGSAFGAGSVVPNGYSVDYTYDGDEIALVSTGVPEPTALGIAVLATPFLLRRQRRVASAKPFANITS